MLFSFVYLVFISLLKLVVGSRRPAQLRDIEVIVLRDQLDILSRQVQRRSCDRVTAPFSPRRAACSRRGAAMVCL
jgi:hypothetical protein